MSRFLLVLFLSSSLLACDKKQDISPTNVANPDLKFSVSNYTYSWPGSLTTNNTMGSKITRENNTLYRFLAQAETGKEIIYISIDSRNAPLATSTYDATVSLTVMYPFGSATTFDRPTFETYNLAKTRITISKLTNGLASGTFSGPLEFRGGTTGVPKNINLTNGEFKDISVLQ